MGLVASQPKHWTVAEYLRMERDAVEKHEYRDGEVVAMAGGTPPHSLIILNVGGEIRSRLKGSPCRAYESNLRVFVPRDVRYVYPDLSVICGPVQFDPKDDGRQTAMNPRVIVEVLSPTTEAYDRGEKFRRYLQIPSFEEYVLVSQVVPVIETYRRQADGTWNFRVYQGLEAVARIETLAIDLPLAEAFLGVEFPPPAKPPDGPDEPPTAL
jgi:Uma2 family endonuclease